MGLYLKNLSVANFILNYNSIIELNESIKEISFLSFKIRLKALNSLISIARLESSESIGFSAVSFELIHFSKKMEEQAQILNSLIYEVLLYSTQLKRLEKKIYLIHKAVDAIEKANHKDMQNFFQKKEAEQNSLKQIIPLKIELILKKVLETTKFCKNGTFIAMCTKIESAYIHTNKMFYSQLAEEITNSLKNMEDALNNIFKIFNEEVNNEEF